MAALPDPGSAEGLVLLKWSFSFLLLPSACSKRGHLIAEVFSIIAGSLLHNVKLLELTAPVILVLC